MAGELDHDKFGGIPRSVQHTDVRTIMMVGKNISFSCIRISRALSAGARDRRQQILHAWHCVTAWPKHLACQQDTTKLI